MKITSILRKNLTVDDNFLAASMVPFCHLWPLSLLLNGNVQNQTELFLL